MTLIHEFNNPEPVSYEVPFVPSFKNRPHIRQADSMEPTEPTGVRKVLAGLREMGLTQVKAEDIAKLLPPDKMEPALHIMSDVRAYFQGECSPAPSTLRIDAKVNRPQLPTSVSLTTFVSQLTLSWFGVSNGTF